MISYWLVRSKWGAVDKTAEFLQNDTWINGYSDKYVGTVKRIQEGDILLLADNSLINYYAECVSNEQDGRHITVDQWNKFKQPINFPAKGAYIKTVVKINNLDLLNTAKKAIESFKSTTLISIKSLSLKNFTQFKDETLNFSKGINIIIGENSTGKTQLIKLIYALVKSNTIFSEFHEKKNKYEFQEIIAKEILSILKPDKLGNLVTKEDNENKELSSNICLDLEKYKISLNFSKKSIKNINIEQEKSFENIYSKKALFIPAKETLSFYDGFASIYPATSFDETFKDLADQLGRLIPNNISLDKISEEIIRKLSKLLDGRIVLENGRFYLKQANKKTEITLIAEGLRKIGTISHLIANGTLDKNSVILWDEPEANLNPKLIKKIVELLILLEKNGIQVFITTHNYFMIKYFDLKMKEDTTINAQFISLFKEDAFVSSEVASNLYDLEHNSIMDEIENVYFSESKLFHKEN